MKKIYKVSATTALLLTSMTPQIASAQVTQGQLDSAVINLNGIIADQVTTLNNIIATQVGNLVAVDTAIGNRIDAATTRANETDTTIDALGNSAANALGGGAGYADGVFTAPSYTIQGSAFNNVGSALGAINNTLNQHGVRLDNLDLKVNQLEQKQDLQNRQANGGIAAAMALGGAMIVPDSTVSVNFNIATYRGEQGFAGNLTFRASERVYFNGGVVGSSVRGSTGGRVGLAFGF